MDGGYSSVSSGNPYQDSDPYERRSSQPHPRRIQQSLSPSATDDFEPHGSHGYTGRFPSLYPQTSASQSQEFTSNEERLMILRARQRRADEVDAYEQRIRAPGSRGYAGVDVNNTGISDPDPCNKYLYPSNGRRVRNPHYVGQSSFASTMTGPNQKESQQSEPWPRRGQLPEPGSSGTHARSQPWSLELLPDNFPQRRDARREEEPSRDDKRRDTAH